MLALLALLVAPPADRVVVVVHDGNGHAAELTQIMVQRLREDGWDAVAAAPPREGIDSLREQDRLARLAGATQVLALDVSAERERRVVGGQPNASAPPSARVGEFNTPPIENVAPDARPRMTVEDLRAETRVMWRRVGQDRFEVDRTFDAGAQASWREDLPNGENREAHLHEMELLHGVFEQIAGQAADAIEMK
jgi:hypothetical protein